MPLEISAATKDTAHGEALAILKAVGPAGLEPASNGYERSALTIELGPVYLNNDRIAWGLIDRYQAAPRTDLA